MEWQWGTNRTSTHHEAQWHQQCKQGSNHQWSCKGSKVMRFPVRTRSEGDSPRRGWDYGVFYSWLWVLGAPWNVFKRWRGWAMRSEKVTDRVMWEIRHYLEDLGFLRWLTYTGVIVNPRQRVVSKLWRLEGRAAVSSCKEGADFHIWGSVFES